MKKLTILLAIVALTTFTFGLAFTQTADQTVTLEVKAVSKISISGPASLVIENAPADLSGLTAASDNSSTFNLIYNGTTGKVTAGIDVAVPANTTLEVTLQGGSKVNIGNATTAVQVLGGLSKTKLTGQSITYDFSATEAAGVIASVDKTITFTVTN